MGENKSLICGVALMLTSFSTTHPQGVSTSSSLKKAGFLDASSYLLDLSFKRSQDEPLDHKSPHNDCQYDGGYDGNYDAGV